MVNFFERLLQAKTEPELFVLVSSLLNPNPIAKIRGKMISGHEGSELVLRLTLEQTLTYLQSNGKNRVFQSETTHVFTLYESGKLTWWMKGQPTLVGLKDIQAALKKFQASFVDQQLPSQV